MLPCPTDQHGGYGKGTEMPTTEQNLFSLQVHGLGVVYNEKLIWSHKNSNSKFNEADINNSLTAMHTTCNNNKKALPQPAHSEDANHTWAEGEIHAGIMGFFKRKQKTNREIICKTMLYI